MRVRIISKEGRKLGEFFSLSEASTKLEISYHRLKKHYTIERIYEEGHWDSVDKDFLKAVCIRRYGYKNPMIV